MLITGGTGLVGSSLSQYFLKKGWKVHHLSRRVEGLVNGIHSFLWDLESDYLDPRALDGVDYIIHLAGAGVADQRWTQAQKQLILTSRLKSSRLLRLALQKQKHQVKALVSASAIGIYGNVPEGIVTEKGPYANDFLADVVKQWEDEVDKIQENQLVIRLVKLRIGIVLSENGGALEKMLLPVKFGLGSPLGSGKQMMSWIHVKDLVSMFAFAINHEDMNGVYNAVAPGPVSNEEFTRQLAAVKGRPLWLPAVPAPVLKMALGEMSEILLGGAQVSSEKIMNAGFVFKYPELKTALQHLLDK
ncbi:TIGR01777 family oxidoreductase [Persicobacter sp. CCB-QB2]|uniref:TIGR01777 family oxidoreductase n=1 Tax=Persicobacter sp. CCB-QB2 TaxID=1561025 RepID=UPI0020A20210|nr:TIGR01777 family oxidoreductase [Persicobacter sp. CCB-QB2]